MTIQEIDLEWYKVNRDKLFKMYPHKFIVISNKAVVKSFASFNEALDFARETLIMGNFVIQQLEESEFVNHLYNHHIA